MFGLNKWNEQRKLKTAIKYFDTVVKANQLQFQSGNDYARILLSQVANFNNSALVYGLATFVEQGYINNPHVNTVVNRIAALAQNVEWGLFEIKDDVKLKEYKTLKDAGQVLEAKLIRSKALERVENTPINKIIEGNANEFLTWSQFVQYSLSFYLLTGNDYIYKFKPSGFKFAEKLYNLPAQAIEIETATDNWRRPVTGYKLLFGTNEQKFNPEDIIHRKNFNPTWNYSGRQDDFLYGLSPLRPLCRTYQRSNESIDAGLAMFRNGFEKGILTPKFNQDGIAHPLKDEAKQAFREEIAKNYGGGKNANKFLISPMEVGWLSMGLKPVDLELLESDKADLETIANVYKYPIHLLGKESTTFNNVGEARKAAYTDATIPELIYLRDCLNMSWINDFNRAENKDYFLDFDTSAIPELQPDKEKQNKIVIDRLERGLLTLGAAAEILELPNDDMDDETRNTRLIKSNLRKFDEVAQPPRVLDENDLEDE